MDNASHSLLVTNARLRGQPHNLFWLWCEAGVIHAIEPMQVPLPNHMQQAACELDAEGGLVLPPFIDSHIHYDSALTAGEPRWNLSGTLFEGIACNGERQKVATLEDYKARALQTVKWQAMQGVQYARVHADVSGPSLTSLQSLLEIKQEVQHYLDVQIIAFPQMGIMAKAEHCELLERALQMGADGVGGIPHFEATRDMGVASVKKVFDLAEQYDTFIDVHCDETDDDQARFVEVMAAEAIARNMGARTSASHVTALHSYSNAYATKVMSLIKRSGMSVVSNPLSNMALQGRFDSFPIRRGVTRIKQLLEMGVNVSLGQDNLRDAFYPLGTAGMLQVLHMGLHACHMLGYDDLNRALDLLTDNAARTLGISQQNYGVAVGKPANFIVMQAHSEVECIRTLAPLRYSIRNGKLLLNQPQVSATLFDPKGEGEKVQLTL